MLTFAAAAALPRHSTPFFPLPITPQVSCCFYNSSTTINPQNPCLFSISSSLYRKLRVSTAKKQLLPPLKAQNPDDQNDSLRGEKGGGDGIDFGWLPALPHVLISSMSNFMFGYHIGVMNGPIVSVAKELGFAGNPILEGLVVSIFIGGAFIGSLSSGFLVDKLGCRRTLQLITIPLILGAVIRWRTMLYIASVPGFILAFGMQFSVESPRWLCKAGRLHEARVVIQNLWGASEVEKVIEEFQSVIREDGTDLDNSWLELLEEPHSRVALIGGALFVLQQFSGINAVLYFSSLTFHDVGISNSALSSLYVGLLNFAGALSALYFMDRQGRQGLLIRSYLGMAVSMFLIVSAISFPVEKEISNNLSILGTLMYIFSFAAGAGPVTGLIIPELSSSRTRGKIMGFSFSVHWVCNFMVGLLFLELAEEFGIAPVYASFGGVSLLAAAFAYFFTVETKGRSLEEIEMSLNPKFRDEKR